MNLWLRLISLLIKSRSVAKLNLPEDASRVAFRVWLHDLDPSFHMNNGRYLTIMDLGRLDLLLRSGIFSHVIKERWTPIASNILIRYRRELRFLQKFVLETRLLHWNDTLVVMEQKFLFEGGPRHGQVAAQALFRGGLYDRNERAFVPVSRLIAATGRTVGPPPEPSAEVQAFLKADDEMKQALRG